MNMPSTEQQRLRAEWQEALSRTLKSPTFEEWLKAKQAAQEGLGLV